MGGHRKSGPPPTTTTVVTLTETEVRQLLRIVVTALGASDALMGVGYVLGAPATTPTLKTMQMVAPLQLWFGVLLVAGVMLLSRRTSSIGFPLAGLVITTWLVFTIVAGTWSWPLLGGVAFLHFLGAWVSGRVARRRRVSQG